MKVPAEPDIVVVPAGLVVLGVPDCPPRPNERAHIWAKREVDVPAFGVARYAVTVAEYLTFAKQTGYPISDSLAKDARFQNPRAPAAYVSWLDAVHYVHWLSRETNKPYRLLRDAEYEKAARGGREGQRYPWGDEQPTGRADHGRPDGAPMSVGSFPANGYGLHDVVGSIWSWCEERYDDVVSHDRANHIYDDTQIRDVRLNPVCRGGSFKTAHHMQLHCAYRHDDPTDGRFDSIGLRLALSV
jgi:formylglycine-generating enzyme required for sulfatase activity